MHLNHAAIGNGRLIALVAPDTSVDWLCLPRFDSPTIFGRLLDEERGGSWRIEPTEEASITQRYERNTNVLVTTIEAEDGTLDVVDFAPWIDIGYQKDAPRQLVRLLIPTDGSPRVRIRFDPAPNYARSEPEFITRTDAIEVNGHVCPLTLFTDLPVDFILNGTPMTISRPRFLALCADGEITATEHASHLRDQTIWSWLEWVKSCAVPEFHADAVLRSALALKLHQYAPTGAIIAAATTSIPEELGTERTWDYRHCWLRDSALVVEALRRLGRINEGERFLLYLRDVAYTGDLQPVYGVGGERELDEVILEHLAGFRGDGPVRIGNAASKHVQYDLMGELLLSMRALLNDPRSAADPREFWELTKRLASEAESALFQPDVSIWEKRSGPAVHTFSQAFCWAAFRSAAALAEKIGYDEEAATWRKTAEDVHPDIYRRSFHESLGSFSESFESDHADAALLLLPMIGFVDAESDDFRRTLRRHEEELVVNGLMKRYRHRDDFGLPRSTFTICSFWWAEALALSGELDRAIEVFERLLDYSNDHGLYSEDIDPDSGEMLGNFPQAYTHVGLINAAVTIDLLKAAREKRVAPWQY